MTTTILAQTIEYDPSAKAWSRYDATSADLLHYHDSEAEAIMASLPDTLREWVLAHSGGNAPGDGLNRRALGAALLLVEKRITPVTETFSMYAAGPHRINCLTRHCSCADHKYTRLYCKHLRAANYLFNAYLAEHGRNLYAYACRTLAQKTTWPDHEMVQLWQSGDGERYAFLRALRNYVYLHISGLHDEIRMAEITKHGLRMVIDYKAYSELVADLKGK